MGKLRYVSNDYWNGLKITIRKYVEVKQQSQESPEEQQAKKNSKKLTNMWNKMKLERMDFLKLAIEKTFVPDPQRLKIAELQDSLLRRLMARCALGSYRDLAQFFTGKQYYLLDENEVKSLKDRLDVMPIVYILLTFAEKDAGMHCPNTGDAVYSESQAKRVLALEGILKEFGFSYSDYQYYKVSDGTHELYTGRKK